MNEYDTNFRIFLVCFLKKVITETNFLS